MALRTGERIGAYEITGPLGKGGMGEVYRGRDTKLDREVAVKVLPESLAGDHERLVRFEREAKALAALNHPNIAQIYAVEGTAFIMELVPGETLGERIKRGAIPLEEALNIASQMASALDAAHEKGIIHRDFKPGNVMETPEGVVKVLDFGLVGRAASTEAGTSPEDSPTMTLAATRAGVIMGTAAYMAPEQASGKPVDKRADIWSFGVVLWEMLTGKRAFEGETVSHVLAAVLTKELDLSAIPVRVRPLLVRCLEKDPRKRLRDIGDAMGLVEVAGIDPVQTGSRARGSALLWAWAVTGMAVLGLVGMGFVHFRETLPPAPPLLQTEITIPADAGFVLGSQPIFLSPDGSRLVVLGRPLGRESSGRLQLYIRLLSARAYTAIPGTEGARGAFWSPDSQWLGIALNGKLMKWSPTGGQPPQVICNCNVFRTGTWNEDGLILFEDEGKPLQRVPASGGVPRNALELDSAFGEQTHLSPYFLPGGKALVFQSNGKVRGAHFFATLDGKVRRHLLDNTNGPASYVVGPNGIGSLAYVNQNQLLARPIDPDTGEFTAEAALLADGVSNGPTFGFGDGGLLVYLASTSARAQRLRWYGRDGRPRESLGEPGDFANHQISPDGKRVIAQRGDVRKAEIWLYDLARATSERVTDDASAVSSPIWTPDGHILYSRRDGQGGVLIERPADALGAETVLVRYGGNVMPRPVSITADGKLIAVSANGGGTREISLIARPEGKVWSAKIERSSFPSFSPDGRWLAYGGSGNSLVLRPVPADPNVPFPQGTREIPTLSARAVRWSADGKELFVHTPAPGAILSIPIDWSDGTPRPGTPRNLFDAPNAISFDVTADGRRFLLAEALGEDAAAPIVLVQNWPALLGK